MNQKLELIGFYPIIYPLIPIPMSKKLIQSLSKLDNSFFLKGIQKDEIYLYSELKASKVIPKNERAPLNIALVIDRSGSMEGDNLDYVKKATEFVIQNLNSKDILSIVQYDDHVQVVSASAKVTNKEDLISKVKAIKSGGMTNLSGGMLEGYNQVSKAKQNGFVNRVLLLSDGLANVGVTDISQLKEIARKHFRDGGIGLSCFGVGAGFNEELMTGLAEHGGANYYFIEKPDQIPQIFAQELQGLLSVVAQNTKLDVEYPASYLNCQKVYGYLFQDNNGALNINYNDVFSEEEKAVLIRFKLKQAPLVSLSFKVTLSYDDVVESMAKIEEKVQLDLTLTEDKALYEQAVDKTVLENIALFVSIDTLKEAMLLVDNRNLEDAKNLLKAGLNYLKAYVEMFPTSERLLNQYKEMETYLENIPNLERLSNMEFSMAQKSSKMANYNMQKRK